jgi:hypothetical protein
VRKAAAGVIVAAVLILLAPAGPVRADDDGVRLQVEVTAEETGKPIAYAAVYVKFKERVAGQDQPSGKGSLPGDA